MNDGTLSIQPFVQQNGRLTVTRNPLIDHNQVTAGAGCGGGIFNGPNPHTHDSLTITSASIDDNFAALGGAIANAGLIQGNGLQAAGISGGEFVGNIASYGGGILNERSGTITNLSGVNISVNTAYNGGGGICNDGTLTLTGCQLSLNGATYFGGGIYSTGNVKLVDSAFTSNQAKQGAGIYDSGALTLSSRCTFHDTSDSYPDVYILGTETIIAG